jgi:hypothetical protein
MRPARYFVRFFPALLLCATEAHAQSAVDDDWVRVNPAAYGSLVDDDINRYSANADFFKGILISQKRFSENGFNWHLLRFENPEKSIGPMWVVPHDDELAAFNSMIAALRQYGGKAITVNSGPGAARMQSGHGTCGDKTAVQSECDPNRNFSRLSPQYTGAFLRQMNAGQPVIALHTNKSGFSGDGKGGAGSISLYERSIKGGFKQKRNGFFGNGSRIEFNNADSFGLSAYRSASQIPDDRSVACRKALNADGVNFWHEPVSVSDSSMSQYLLLNHPSAQYFNAESREETDTALATRRHLAMVTSYLKFCEAAQPLLSVPAQSTSIIETVQPVAVEHVVASQPK